MSLIVYFSSRSENTHRFVQRLGLPAVRIPLNEREHLQVDEPYILIVPSYGGGGTAGVSGVFTGGGAARRGGLQADRGGRGRADGV